MVTALSFPYIRPRRSPSYKKKVPHRPAPLKLQTTFFQPDLKKTRKGSTGIEEPAVKAVRGSISGPDDHKEVMVPFKMEMELTTAEPQPESEEEQKQHSEPEHLGEPLLTPTALDFEQHKPATRAMAETRPVSPQESLRTIINLDSADNSDSDLDISPISDERQPVRSGSAIRRFFPELATNIDLVSPVSADKKTTQKQEQKQEQMQMTRSALMERELESRVQNLYRTSADEMDSAFERKTSSSEGSDGIFDGASSCYSRRSSLSSIDTEHLHSVEKEQYSMSADAYSIISPVAAGVFDDAASVCPSRVPSMARLQVPTPTRSVSAGSSPTRSPLPRCNSVASVGTTTTTNTMSDLKNKPLPLEPVSEPDSDIAPSPLAVRRPTLQPRNNSFNGPSIYSQQSPSHSHLAVRRSATTLHSPSSHACHSCGGHAPKPRKTNRSQWADRMEKGEPHIRQLPSLAQAAEELEDVLADLQKQGSKQRTLLILDGPLQVSRHNGDLVARRPAPLPPSTKPHSMTHASPSVDLLRSSKSNKSSKSSKSAKSNKSEKEKDKPKRSNAVQKDRRPSNLAAIPESESQNKDKGKQKEKEKEKEKEEKDKGHGHKMSKSVDDALETLNKEASSRSSTPNEDGKKDKDKLKKTFTFSMKSFKRNKPVRSATAAAPLVPSGLSSPSDASFDPLEQPLSPSDPSEPVEEPVTKRADLLLQLPRLQTQDLELSSIFDRVNAAGKGVAQSTSGSPSQSNPSQSSEISPTHPSTRQTNQRKDQSLTPPEEKIVVDPNPSMMVSERPRHAHAFVSTAQASSVQLPPNQVYELAATPPSPTSTLPVFEARQPIDANVNFPPEFPEGLTKAIMESIDSLDDLFNLVLVNKRFYGIFKKYELPMIKSTLFKMSPPAWELREMSPPWATETQFLEPDSQVPEYTPSLYLDRYAQDIYTLAKLKSMILVRCSPFLRRDTVRGLSGLDIKRAEEVDDAFWRIWTFCRIFGSNKGRENDLEGQVDWLRGGSKARGHPEASSCMTEPFGMNNVLFEPPEGFGRGNGRGLSPKQLYDMTEIWTCMGVLLQPLHGKCIEARRVGIYDGMDVPTDDPAREEQVLEEWTSFVLTIGLSAVLGLSSLAPAEATAAFFNNAKASGLTKWAPTETETSRSSFLKEAVSRVYEDHERSISNEDDASPADTRSESQTRQQDQQEREQRHAAYKLELRARRVRNTAETRGRELGTGFADERPMSEFSTIVHNLDGTEPGAPPVPPLPSLMLDRASTSTTSTIAAPRTPNYTPPPPPIQASDLDLPFPPPSRSPPHQQSSLFQAPAPAPPPAPVSVPQPSLPPQVQDPVDRAINRMVNELGFEHEDVKWALKITDTGEGIDVEAAEALLKQQKQKKKKPFSSRKESLLHSVMKRQRSTDSGWRFA